MIQIVGVAGLPRSGSTLLQQILGQNPKHHVTPTSGVPMLIRGIQQQWSQHEPFKAQGIAKVAPRMAGAISGTVAGFYKNEIMQGKIVFDKSRMWPSCVELMEQSFMEKMKIILCVRDVPDVLASFERIYRKNTLFQRGPMPPTAEGRAMNYLKNESVVGASINGVHDVFNRNLEDRLVVVPFNSLCSNPEETLKMIHAQLNLPDFKYDFGNVKQITQEDDTVFGFAPGSLHQVREGTVTAPSTTWRDIYPKEFGEGLLERYGMITELNKPKK